jgi:hypothetical protein
MLGGDFSVDSGKGVKELVGDVGEDGGAARGDAISGEKQQKAGKEVVDVRGGGEFREAVGEAGGQVGGLA